MEAHQLTKQMIAFQKQALSNWQNTMDTVQIQASDVMDQMVDQALWLPQTGRDTFAKWHTLIKEERKHFNTYLNKGFAIYESFLLESPMAASPKSKPGPKTKSGQEK
jgi:hypothetical protein